jgi:hypothetical protein
MSSAAADVTISSCRLFSTTLSTIAFRLACVGIIAAYGAIVRTRIPAGALSLSLASFRQFFALDESAFVVLGLFGLVLAQPSSFYIVPSAAYALFNVLPRVHSVPVGFDAAKLAQMKSQLTQAQPAVAQSMAQLEVTAFPLFLLQAAFGMTPLYEALFYAKFYLAPRARKSAEVAAYVRQLTATISSYADRIPIVSTVWNALKSFGARL